MSKSLDGVLTKKANTKETFTEDQVEHLRKCMDPKDGYMHFAKILHIYNIASKVNFI